MKQKICVLLATAQVIVIAQNGNTKVRALINQGSEISLISERLVQRLKLPRKQSSVSLVGIGAQKLNKIRDIINFKLRSHDGNFEHGISAHILSKLTTTILSVEVEKAEWPHQGTQSGSRVYSARIH